MKVASLILSSFFALVQCDLSNEWFQDPISGSSFEAQASYDYFGSRWYSYSYDQSDAWCSEGGGRTLASIHSQEENDFIVRNLTCDHPNSHPEPAYRNIGLRCVGDVCKWNDGSPITYLKFKGQGPPEDGATRCYTIYNGDNGQWTPRDCGQHEGDCWICSVPQQAHCTADETAYKNGCVSVHLTPLDQNSAEEACPGGGHLVSIHGSTENDWYTKLATNSGINGTVYIGGQFSQRGAFEWTDGSHPNTHNWAKSFPDSVYGNCVQMMLATQFGMQGQWTNVDCATKQPYMCFRDDVNYGPTIPPPIKPETPAYCEPNLYETSPSGTFTSPNYPLSIPANQTCALNIGSDDDTKTWIQFVSYDCQSGTTLSLYDGLYADQPFAVFTSNSPGNDTYTASASWLKIVFSAGESPVGTGWKLQYTVAENGA